MYNVLIIANARYNGGLSGSDNIYLNFLRYWKGNIHVKTMLDIDYKPFVLCYIHRILLGCVRAIFDNQHYDFVYSASDFFPDALPACIYRIKGQKWVAGYYLQAFRDNKLYYYSQKLAKYLITKFADIVIVTNPSMLHLFPNKKRSWINGGIDLNLAGISNQPKKYDCVFCGRIHPTKGIDELIDIWHLVRKELPEASLAIIGDGDLGVDYIKYKLFQMYGYEKYNGITLLGYMGSDRYDIYKQSKVVLYTTPKKYEHFSMSPVEAMACGCPLVAFDLDVINIMDIICAKAKDKKEFADWIIKILSWDNEQYNYLSLTSYDCAKLYNYKDECLRVFKDIELLLYE